MAKTKKKLKINPNSNDEPMKTDWDSGEKSNSIQKRLPMWSGPVSILRPTLKVFPRNDPEGVPDE